MIGLAELDWFSALSADRIERLSAVTTRRRFVPGQRIIERGEPGRSVLFVLSGQVLAVCWTQSGREIVFNDIGPGGAFGEYSVITGGPRSLSVYARTDCILLELPGACLLELIDNEPSLRISIMRGLIARIHHLTERVEELTVLGVGERLRAYLLRVALEQGGIEAGRVLQDLPTHAEIANIVGANREAVTRHLAALKRKGIIESGRGFLRILNPDALMAEVGDTR